MGKYDIIIQIYLKNHINLKEKIVVKGNSAFKKLFAPTDMTVGTPWKSILAFTFPMLIGNIAQQLYNTVDTIVVGKYIGDNALSAVGSAGPLWYRSISGRRTARVFRIQSGTVSRLRRSAVLH